MRTVIALLVSLSIVLSCYAGESATDPAPRSIEYKWMSVEAWQQKHTRLVERSKQGNVPLMFLGDSITEGWGGAGKAVWQRDFAPLGAANYGIGGDTTQNILWRLANGEADGIAPKAIVLLIGTNNFGLSHHQPDDVIAGVTAVAKDLRTRFPQAKLLLMAIFPRDEKPGTANRTRIATVNEALMKLADNDHITYLDLGPKLLETDGTISKAVMPDFLHLSNDGYERWSAAIKETVSTWVK